MPLVIVSCKIEGNPPRGIGRKMPAIMRASLRATAGCWHGTIMPRHFTPGNNSRYRFDPRNKVYLEEIKKHEGVGGGRYILDLLKGESLRWFRTFVTVTATQRQATLRMQGPTYFEHPFIGTYVNPRTGRIKTISRQPDKPAELTQVNSADHDNLTKFAQSDVILRTELALRGI